MQRTADITRGHAPSGLTPAGCRSAGTGDLLPDTTLPTPHGERVALGQYSALRNLVIVLRGVDAADASVAHLLAAFAASRAAIADEEAEVLVVQSGERSQWSDGPHPFAVLVDEDAAFHRDVGAVDASGDAAPAVFITDRFREIYHVFRPTDADWPPSARDVLDWLVFMNIQCPECGAPEW
jgi:peroxiredoxin